MTRYAIISPEYTSYEYIGDDMYVPEVGCDYVEVEADSKRAALVVGVRAFRQMKRGWVTNQDSDKLSPFTGLKAELLDWCICPPLEEPTDYPRITDDYCPGHGAKYEFPDEEGGKTWQ